MKTGPAQGGPRCAGNIRLNRKGFAEPRRPVWPEAAVAAHPTDRPGARRRCWIIRRWLASDRGPCTSATPGPAARACCRSRLWASGPTRSRPPISSGRFFRSTRRQTDFGCGRRRMAANLMAAIIVCSGRGCSIPCSAMNRGWSPPIARPIAAAFSRGKARGNSDECGHHSGVVEPAAV